MRRPTNKMLAAASLILAATAAPLHGIAQTEEDERAIRDLIEAHAVAWNGGDIKAAANVYSDNANVVAGPEHRYYIGRNAIEEMHRAALSGPNPRAHLHPRETIRIHFVRPDIAVADVESHWFPHGDAGSGAAPTSKASVFVVLEKIASEWRVAAQRITTLRID
jgi:uncharacterized protein (TIGR02246 family)